MLELVVGLVIGAFGGIFRARRVDGPAIDWD
jgi:uncharacterized protein YneF (UPF0154 family)